MERDIGSERRELGDGDWSEDMNDTSEYDALGLQAVYGYWLGADGGYSTEMESLQTSSLRGVLLETVFCGNLFGSHPVFRCDMC